MLTSHGASSSHILSGILLCVAGTYQWSSLKHACLRFCRNPFNFLMANWREGTTGALYMGLKHGFVGEETLDGLNLAFMLDIPGRMSEGNWTSAIYVDERANEAVADYLTAIMKGELGGPPTVLGILVGNVIGVKKVPIAINRDGKNWKVEIPKIIKGTVGTIQGTDPASDVIITNTNYWIAPDVHIAQSGKNKYRDYGRNWEFTGQSAEYMKVEWAA